MSKFTALNPALFKYMLRHSLREHPVLRELRMETGRMKQSEMQIAPNQGQFMQMLVRILDAKKIVEVGTFTGYSSLAMALAMGEEGRIFACDTSEEWTAIARKYWKEAGVNRKIDLRLAPARDTLDELLKEGHQGTFDLAFIDADKENYDTYYEQCLQLLRKGGLLLIDNVLWDGTVLDEETNDPETKAIRALNKKVAKDERVELAMIPIADGLSICRKL